MATGEKVYIADKETVDKIHALLLSSEIGLAILKELLLKSAGDNETIAASVSTLGENIGIVKECITDNANGLGAIKEALEGRANESTSTAIKGLLENGTYGLNALKNAVTGRANETTVAAVKALLENGTYGLNALKTAVTGNVKTIKSVQRGTVNANSVPVTISVAAVNMSKSFVMISNGGLLSDNNNSAGNNASSYAELTSSTTIMVVFGGGNNYSYKLSWQLVEFY